MTKDFSGFGLPPKLLQSLARMHFDAPTPIQVQALPLAIAGRDILGSAQTGTGKTGAFGIPLVAHLMSEPNAVALIVTPTRELATQVIAMMEQFIPDPKIKTALLIGGAPMPKQFRQLQAKPRIIVGTPGRINDHLTRNPKLLDHVHFLVLDETDRMLDMGFGVQIDKIVAHLPRQRQTMLFSATLPPAIAKLAGKYLNNPERIQVGSTVEAAPQIDQKVMYMADEKKGQTLLDLLPDLTSGSIVIFVKTKFGTERLAKKLAQQKYSAEALHGDLRQGRRDRVIREFRDMKFFILVATDVAARGLDVPHIETVINYDLPQCPEDFIHRIGRTARAGATGQAISFVTPSERAKWKAIQNLMHPGEPVAGDNGPRETFKKSGAKPKKKWGTPKRSFHDAPRGEKKGDAKSRDDKPHEKRTYRDSTPRDDKPHEKRTYRDSKPRDDKPQEKRTYRDSKPRDDKPQERTYRDAKPRDDKPQEKKYRDSKPHAAKPYGAKPFGAKAKDGKPQGTKPLFKKFVKRSKPTGTGPKAA